MSSNVIAVGIHKGSLLGTAVGEEDVTVVMLNGAGVQQWMDSATCVTIGPLSLAGGRVDA